MFKSEGLTHEINVMKLITRVLAYGLVAFTEKRERKENLSFQQEVKRDYTYSGQKFLASTSLLHSTTWDSAVQMFRA